MTHKKEKQFELSSMEIEMNMKEAKLEFNIEKESVWKAVKQE